MVLSSAMSKTDKHRETVMMASLAPEGYSGSSVSFSKPAASRIGVVSMTFSLFVAAACLEDELSDDGFPST